MSWVVQRSAYQYSSHIKVLTDHLVCCLGVGLGIKLGEDGADVIGFSGTVFGSVCLDEWKKALKLGSGPVSAALLSAHVL